MKNSAFNFLCILVICSFLFPTASHANAMESPDVTAKTISESVKMAKRGKKQGYLKLLYIADNNPNIAVEQSESAYDGLMLLLYENPKRWIEILSTTQFERAKRIVDQLGIPDSLSGAENKDNFRTEVFARIRTVQLKNSKARALKQVLLEQERK